MHRPPAFAFVSFEYPEDAEDAVRGRGKGFECSLAAAAADASVDGVMFEGQRLRVEMSRSSQDGYVGGAKNLAGKEEDERQGCVRTD